MATERAEEIASLRGTKAVFQRHIKNTERELIELMKHLNVEDEDQLTEINALKNSYFDKV